MEIRLLYGNELQLAVSTAQEVFEACVRPRIATLQEADHFYQFVRVERLWMEMNSGSLYLWGVLEDGYMCAVGAIRDNGQIVMLYVRPQHTRRHIGMQLVNAMSMYAANVLGRDRVTICVSPVSAASYFYHIGFTYIQGSLATASYIPLERRIWSVPQGILAGGAAYGTAPGMWNGPHPGVMPGGAPHAGVHPGSTYAGGNGPQSAPGSAGGGCPHPGTAPWGVPNGAGYEFWPGDHSRGYVQNGLYGGAAYGGPQYRYQMYPETMQKRPKPEVTYPVRTVSVKRLLAIMSCVLVICFSVMTGVTIYHISVDGLFTAEDEAEDGIPEGLGAGEEI